MWNGCDDHLKAKIARKQLYDILLDSLGVIRLTVSFLYVHAAFFSCVSYRRSYNLN